MMDFQAMCSNKITVSQKVIHAIQETFDEIIRVQPEGHGKFKVFSAESGKLLATVEIEEQ